MPAGRDEIIPLVEGSVFHERDRFGNYRPTRPAVVATGGFSDLAEQCYHRRIRVNHLTGRAQVETDPGLEVGNTR